MDQRLKNKLAAVAGLAIAAIIVVPSLLLFDISTPSYTVKEGSQTYTVIGGPFSSNVTQINNLPGLNALTTLPENGNYTFHIKASGSVSVFNVVNNTPLFYVSSLLYVKGNLPGNLHPTGLRIAVNPLEGVPSAFAGYIRNYTTQNNKTYLPALLHPFLDFINASPSQGGPQQISLSIMTQE